MQKDIYCLDELFLQSLVTTSMLQGYTSERIVIIPCSLITSIYASPFSVKESVPIIVDGLWEIVVPENNIFVNLLFYSIFRKLDSIHKL